MELDKPIATRRVSRRERKLALQQDVCIIVCLRLEVILLCVYLITQFCVFRLIS